jgi:flavin reductase (DIM6/NTAB) family NADH-FMN oxidoreductase RutF
MAGGDRRHDAVNSLTSISLDPPLVSLRLRRGSGFLTDLLETRTWAVSILDATAGDVARLFAQDRATRAAAVDAPTGWSVSCGAASSPPECSGAGRP